MPDYSTKALVETHALELRKKHSALDWSAKVDDLIEKEGLSQHRVSPFATLYGTFTKLVSTTTKKVKALLSVKEQLILLSDDLPAAKEPFAKGHELGHSSLPWHRDILFVCDEHDLSAGARAQLEFEANAFAPALMLPAPLLEKVYAEYPTSMETVLFLRNASGASIEVCAIRYATNHPRNCVLLVMREEDANGEPVLVLKRKALSNSAVKTTLGNLAREQTFPRSHTFFQNSRGDGPTKVTVGVKGTEKKYQASLFNNTYVVMALVTDETQ